jgi:hypothetical protein
MLHPFPSLLCVLLDPQIVNVWRLSFVVCRFGYWFDGWLKSRLVYFAQRWTAITRARNDQFQGQKICTQPRIRMKTTLVLDMEIERRSRCCLLALVNCSAPVYASGCLSDWRWFAETLDSMANDHDYWNITIFGGQQKCADIVHFNSRFSESTWDSCGSSLSAIMSHGNRRSRKILEISRLIGAFKWLYDFASILCYLWMNMIE